MITQNLGNFEATAQLDVELGTLARQAKTDTAARDRLYFLLEWKIRRFNRRFYRRVWEYGICEAIDVDQIGYLVFCDLVATWPGEDSFLGYFFSRFSWRLARALDVLGRGWPAAHLVPYDLELHGDVAQPDDNLMMIDAVAGLSPRQEAVLRLRIEGRLRVREIAEALDVHTRTVHREFAVITSELQHVA